MATQPPQKKASLDLPSPGSQAPSTMSKTSDAREIFTKDRLYIAPASFHHHAIECVALISALFNGDALPETLFGAPLAHQRLDTTQALSAIAILKQRVDGSKPHFAVPANERTFTSILSNILTREVFRDNISLFHQYNTHQDYLCDLVLADAPALNPSNLFGFGGAKNDLTVEGESSAFAQSLAYSIGYADVAREKVQGYPVHLLFPCTTAKLSLHLAFYVKERVVVVPLISAEWEDKRATDVALNALSLISNAITDLGLSKTAIEVATPSPDLKHEAVLHATNSTPFTTRLFKVNENGLTWAYKYYDYEFAEDLTKIPLSTFQAAGMLTHAQQADLAAPISGSPRLTLLKYPWIEGSHTAQRVSQFKDVFDALHNLHAAGVVHSDVREGNIVFHVDGVHASLIDIDLADKVGTFYPNDFAPLGSVRHPRAMAGNVRVTEHDMHALGWIMSKYKVEDDKLQNEWVLLCKEVGKGKGWLPKWEEEEMLGKAVVLAE